MEPPHANPLRRSLSSGRDALLPIGLFSLIFNLLALIVPLYMMQVYDRVLTSGVLDTLLYLTAMAVGIILIMAALDAIRSAIATRISAWLEQRLAPEALARAIETAFHQGAYTTQALRDLATIRGCIGGATLFTLFDALWAPLYLAVVFLVHPWLGFVSLLGGLTLMGLALLNERVTHALLHTANTLWIKSMQNADMAVRNAEAVTGMGMTGAVTARWMVDNDRVLDLQTLASHRSAIIVAATKVVRLLLQVGILAVGALLVLDRQISPGSMIAASLIMGRALAPVEQAIGTWKQIIGYREARTRLMRFFGAPTLPRHGMTLPRPLGRLTVEDVTFAPPGAAEAVLHRLSFAAEPGEVVAVVGPSAAGKSSLARLIVAAWQPTSGAVRLDGADVYDWPREDFGRHVGYLPQDVELFAGTVRDNIARMREADDAEVIKAARIAGMHEMILRLPDGYQTQIGDGGARLSAGQRQRVALARAVFGGPRLVVLDEPNANLDTDGELALAQAVTALRESGATTIVISHRQNILMQTDKILHLRNGRVDRFGPRNEVLRHLMTPRQQGSTLPSPLHPVVAAEPGKRESAP